MSDIESSTKRIESIINDIEEGQIKIPPLQRGFVWGTDQIVHLLDSIYNGYPIGSLLIWRANQKLNATRNIAGFDLPDVDPEYPVDYILDGQQRLSSLYGVFCKERDGANDDTLKLFNIVFDFESETFKDANVWTTENYVFPMNCLLDPNKLLQEMNKMSDDQRDVIANLRSSFADYQIPVIVTKKKDLSEVGIIFERINNTGTKLSLFDLMVAWTWTPAFHLKEEFSSLYEVLEEKNFSNIDKKILLQCISAIINESASSKDIISTNPSDIRSQFPNTKKSLEKVIDYLSTVFNVKSEDLLPHSHQIVPLCYFFSKVHTPTTEQKKVINSWFWNTSFSPRFSYSTDTQINEDIAFFKKVISGVKTNKSAYKYSISDEDFEKTKFSKSNWLTRASIVLLSSQSPKNLVNGNPIDISDALSIFNKKHFHHIFPKAFLSSKGKIDNEINIIANFCILPADSNNKIKDKAPSDYFFNIISDEDRETVISSNLLTPELDIYKEDNYEKFIKKRSKILIEALNKKISESLS